MSDLQETPKPTAAALLSGILSDLQQLMEQQFQLIRQEIAEEVQRSGSAVSIVAFGVGVLFLDAGILCQALVHLLHWMASPSGTDAAWLPLWACFAVVATVLLFVGGILVAIGRTRLKSIDRFQKPVADLFQDPVP